MKEHEGYLKDMVLLGIKADENIGCEECSGVAEMQLPLSQGVQKVNYCPMCGRKL
jgi:hypothetical protein